MDGEVRIDDISGMVLLVPGLQSLVDLLRERGFKVIGPTVRDGAVIHAEIESVDQLPRGVGDLQDAGSYRLRERGDEAMFGYVAGGLRRGSRCCSPPASCCGADDGSVPR